jgi:hypothetical protein
MVRFRLKLFNYHRIFFVLYQSGQFSPTLYLDDVCHLNSTKNREMAARSLRWARSIMATYWFSTTVLLSWCMLATPGYQRCGTWVRGKRTRSVPGVVTKEGGISTADLIDNDVLQFVHGYLFSSWNVQVNMAIFGWNWFAWCVHIRIMVNTSTF